METHEQKSTHKGNASSEEGSPAVNPELHLYIVWHNALGQAATILADLNTVFDVRRVYAIDWSDEHFSQNMSRFYGQKLPRDSFKEAHVGRGPFLAVLAVDREPTYELRVTSRGPQTVNARCFDAKERYRALTGGGHRIHGTTSPRETDHDLALLLNQNAEEFLASHPDSWDGNVEELACDLAGAQGWESLAQLLHVMNASISYAIMRNFEELPESATLPGHGDIDLLCSSTSEMAFITNATPVAQEPYRVLHRVLVGGKELLFDFRALGDNYYDLAWEKAMLDNRVLSAQGFYHLGSQDHFHSLLYHAVVHKPSVAPDYLKRLAQLSPAEFHIAGARTVLDEFFAEHGYRFVEPDDQSVYFNTEFVGLPRVSLSRVFAGNSLGVGLQKLFDQTNDCSSQSSEFHAVPFRTRNLVRHFSANRAMFFEGLGLPENSSILEMAAESGVLTRWFGERFSRVVAVEPRASLSLAIGKRCRDLRSVKISEHDLRDFDQYKVFDVAVSFIDGLLEPTLKCASKALKKSGLLILGLETTVPVISKKDAILDELRAHGFKAARFFPAFPNTILPRVVFSEGGVRASKKAYGYWASFAKQDGGGSRISDLEAAGASAQGKLDSLATGCYVLAARDEASLPDVPWQACAVSSEARHPFMRATTRAVADGNSIIVQKRGIPRASGVFRFQPVVDSPLFEGHLGSAAFMYALRAGDLGQFLSLLKAHAQFLDQEFAFANGEAYPPMLAEGDILLRGEALDAVPQNVVIEGSTYRVFDLEWQVAMPLPLSYVLYRSLSLLCLRVSSEEICTAFKLQQYGLPPQPSPRDLARFLIDALGVFGPLSDRALQRVAGFDQRFEHFAGRGDVRCGEESYFERYHLAIAQHAQGDSNASMKTLDGLQSSYPDAPETAGLAEALQGKQATQDEHILC